MIFIFFIKYRNQALQAFAFINFSMLFLTCNILNRVIRSIHSGSCGAVDEEGQVTFLLMLQHQLLQLCGDHLASEVDEYFRQRLLLFAGICTVKASAFNTYLISCWNAVNVF